MQIHALNPKSHALNPKTLAINPKSTAAALYPPKIEPPSTRQSSTGVLESVKRSLAIQSRFLGSTLQQALPFSWVATLS